MTINEVFLNKEISTQAYHTCIDNNIETLLELKMFYSTNGTFEKLRNCNDKSNLELLKIVIKYYDFASDSKPKVDQHSEFDYYFSVKNFTQNQINDLNNVILNNFEKLSIRSTNAISKFFSGSINTESFLKKVLEQKDFNLNVLKKLNNVGRKSIPEIIAFFSEIKNAIILINEHTEESEFLKSDSNSKHNDFYSKVNEIGDLNIQTEKTEFLKFDYNSKHNDFYSKVYEISDLKIQIINDYVSLKTHQLSVRSFNAICNCLQCEPNILELTNQIFQNKNFNISNLKNVGRRSTPELQDYLYKIKKFYFEILFEENLSILQKHQQRDLDSKSQQQSMLFDSEVGIFKLVDKLINEYKILNQKDTFIFKNTHNIYVDNKNINLKKISEILGLNRERIRQIRNMLLNKFRDRALFLKQHNRDCLYRYDIYLDNDFITITDKMCEAINSLDGINFTKQFMTFILSILLDKSYSTIGNVEDVLIEKSRASQYRHIWKNIYLIKNELFEKLDFKKYIEDVEVRINQKIDEEYKFSFKSYLSNFINKEGFFISEEMFFFCEKLINDEFSIYLNINEDIIFERNTIKTVKEFALEALEDLGVPTHIDIIGKRIKELYPDFDKTISSANLKREYGFVPFGRSSVFGLKKWELENNTIKSGTIRSIAEEFLLNNQNPMHITEISNYVLQYRPESNKKSIIYNLKMEDNNRFLFFKDSYVGLKNKKYNNNQFEILNKDIKIKTWEDNYEELINFIKNNDRLPSSRSSSLFEEIKISKWLGVQKTKINNNFLVDSKKFLIQNLISNYKVRNRKAKLCRNEGYEKLSDFIINTNRLPSANKSDEKQLYAFFYKQRKLYEDSKLDIEEETKFIEIAKLLQNR